MNRAEELNGENKKVMRKNRHLALFSQTYIAQGSLEPLKI